MMQSRPMSTGQPLVDWMMVRALTPTCSPRRIEPFLQDSITSLESMASSPTTMDSARSSLRPSRMQPSLTTTRSPRRIRPGWRRTTFAPNTTPRPQAANNRGQNSLRSSRPTAPGTGESQAHHSK